MDAHEPVGGVVVRGEGADDRLRVVEEQERVVRRDPTLHLRDHARRHPNVRVEPVISLDINGRSFVFFIRDGEEKLPPTFWGMQ